MTVALRYTKYLADQGACICHDTKHNVSEDKLVSTCLALGATQEIAERAYNNYLCGDYTSCHIPFGRGLAELTVRF